jgi:hypothetical protein
VRVIERVIKSARARRERARVRERDREKKILPNLTKCLISPSLPPSLPSSLPLSLSLSLPPPPPSPPIHPPLPPARLPARPTPFLSPSPRAGQATLELNWHTHAATSATTTRTSSYDTRNVASETIDDGGGSGAGAGVGGGGVQEHKCMVCVAEGQMCADDAHIDQGCLVSAASLTFHA